MSRSHVANMHSISTPPGTPLSTPRAIPSPTRARDTPGHVTPLGSSSGHSHVYGSERDRPRDSGVGAIGAFFAAPYDSDVDDSDADEISTPVDGRSRSPATGTAMPADPQGQGQLQGRARAGRVSVAVVNTPKGYKDVLSAKIRSQAGELDGDWSDEEDTVEYGNRPQPQTHAVSRTQLQAPSPSKGRQSDESGRVRPLTVVEFPEPSLQPEQGHGRGYPQQNGNGNGFVGTQPLRPAGPVRSNSDHPHSPAAAGYPRTPPRSNSNPTHSQPHPGHHLQPHARPQPSINTSLSPPRTIALPPPSSPISPLLAAPPKPHFSPLSPPSSPFARSSGGAGAGAGARDSTNGSIRGFDAMAEKKAFFREGQEEFMYPLSTRTERKRAGRQNTKSAMLLSGMGMDFWKRFSVHVKLDEAEKAQAQTKGTGSGSRTGKGSEWLNKAQHTRSKIKKMVWAFLVLLVCLIIALVVYFLLRPKESPQAIATSL